MRLSIRHLFLLGCLLLSEVVFAQSLETKFSPTFGVTFKPLGASLGVIALTRDDAEHLYTASFIYDSALNSHLKAQVLLRYDDKPENAKGLNWAVQLGTWKHDPHLLDNTETALGVQGEVSARLELAVWGVRLNSHLGLIHLPSFDAFQPDARASATLFQETLDPWGYRVSGHSIGLTTLWGATPTGNVFAAWADGWYAWDVGGTLELALRVGYKPEEVVPPLRPAGWAGTLSAGYRKSLPVRFQVASVRLERITLEPKVRSYWDESFGLGADVAISADVRVNDKASSVALNIGYVQQAVWFKVGFLSPF
jgi:hypothetical protein